MDNFFFSGTPLRISDLLRNAYEAEARMQKAINGDDVTEMIERATHIANWESP